MAKHGGTKHLKTVVAPRTVPIERKLTVWMTRPRAGPHKFESAIPLSLALKKLKFALVKRDAKTFIRSGSVRIDGKVVKDLKYPVGVMDVLEVEGNAFRVLLDTKNHLTFKDTSKPNVKVCRVEKKHRTKGGKLHITLHDGRCIIDYNCSIGDSIVISLPDGKPVAHIPLSVNGYAMIIKGKHVGKFVTINNISEATEKRKAEVTFTYNGETFNTPKEYVFPVKEEYI
jgi:small subunit ribosomal protein S4e